MLSRMLSSAAVALVLLACAPTREIVDSHEGPTLADVTTSIQGKSVTVSLRDSSVYEGDVVPSGPDTLALIVGSKEERKGVPLKDVHTIRVEANSGWYVVGGAVVGGAIGAGIGYGLYTVASGGTSSGMFGNPSVAAAGLGGIIGLLVGGVAGAVAVPETDFLFVDSPNQPVTIKVQQGDSFWPRPSSDEDVLRLEFWRGGKKAILRGDPIQIRYKGNSIFITATRAEFLKAGITVE